MSCKWYKTHTIRVLKFLNAVESFNHGFLVISYVFVSQYAYHVSFQLFFQGPCLFAFPFSRALHPWLCISIPASPSFLVCNTIRLLLLMCILVMLFLQQQGHLLLSPTRDGAMILSTTSMVISTSMARCVIVCWMVPGAFCWRIIGSWMNQLMISMRSSILPRGQWRWLRPEHIA